MVKCSNCKKERKENPCEHCGHEHKTLAASGYVEDKFGASNDGDGAGST